MASAPRSYKDQLQGWLGKNKLKSSYNESTNAAGQFVCELTVSGCSFKPIGVGARKAAAKEDAAAQLVQWLRRAGRWEPSEAASPSRAVPPPPAADDTSRNSNQNPKSALNIRLQSMQVPCKYSTPPSVNGGFECTLEIDLPDGRVKFRSTGLSTKEAERACARDALLHLDRRPGGQLRRTVSAAPAQADGVPPLPRSASLPWRPTRPDKPNPKSLLNEFLQQNGAGVVDYSCQELGQGTFRTTGRIDLEEAQGFKLQKCADGPSKAESGKRCAEELIRALEQLNLLEPSAVVSDHAPQSVREVLRDAVPVPTGPSAAAAAPVSAPPLASFTGYPLSPPAGGSMTIIHGPVSVYNQLAPASPSAPAAAAAASPPPPPPPPPPVPARLTHLMDSSEVVTPRHILKVSMKIGNLRKTIGQCLGLEPIDIENCCFKEDDPHEINRKILGVWRERESREATVGRLCRALWECGATEAVDTLAEEPSTPQP
ncbi:SH3 and multiple ankyrin repeat domains protein 1-like isoform X2 [Amphibalanus amphitrite]|uniref:SH3 and multiple ankyrin repeat domains protein 1-like isoform X2 n=1 Tax=Amphibalanus amphitrite TaxID=1232801 RepID=UPI001C8FA73A|nr:SH3 and multiple ankyrin repeat domains protein 1-like isoform X2 [Amphibalanus amphitrite]